MQYNAIRTNAGSNFNGQQLYSPFWDKPNSAPNYSSPGQLAAAEVFTVALTLPADAVKYDMSVYSALI